MGWVSFIYRLLKFPRPARRQNPERTTREFMHGKFSKGFFAAASPRCELQPVRLEISKGRRR
jgi:hypothetical protein